MNACCKNNEKVADLKTKSLRIFGIKREHLSFYIALLLCSIREGYPVFRGEFRSTFLFSALVFFVGMTIALSSVRKESKNKLFQNVEMRKFMSLLVILLLSEMVVTGLVYSQRVKVMILVKFLKILNIFLMVTSVLALFDNCKKNVGKLLIYVACLAAQFGSLALLFVLCNMGAESPYVMMEELKVAIVGIMVLECILFMLIRLVMSGMQGYFSGMI